MDTSDARRPDRTCTFDGIRIRFCCRIIPVIFNPFECAIRIELVIIPVVTTTVFHIEHAISFDGDVIPGVNRRVVLGMLRFFHFFAYRVLFISPRGLWLNDRFVDIEESPGEAAELFLHGPDFCLFKMPVEGIDLTNPLPFHDEYGKSIVNADGTFLGEPDTFPVIVG